MIRVQKEELLRVKWHAAFCDEAHRLKSEKSQLNEAASLLNTKLRYGLTGTAMPVSLLVIKRGVNKSVFRALLIRGNM